MADTERENVLGFVDKRRTQATQGTNNNTIGIVGASTANYSSVASLRANLASLNGAYYTSARLNEMTKNDMVYALRTISDAGGI